MAKKLAKKIAAKDAQCMLRLPPGLRDKVATRAAQNGRSMNTEIIEAIERHLQGADRITRLWEFFERHRESIESIPLLLTPSKILKLLPNAPGNFMASCNAGRKLPRQASQASRPSV